MRGRTLLLISLAALTVSAVGYTAYRLTDRAPEQINAGADTAAAFDIAVPISVEGATVVQDTLILYITATGESEARRQISISPDASGRIARLNVKDNDVVSAGTLVMSLDTTDFAFALQQAKLSLRDAQARHKELLLTDDLMITDPRVRASRDTAARIKSGLEAAQLRLLEAEIAYGRSRVTVPFTGRIADLKPSVGARVSAGTEIMKLLELDPIRVTLNVLEANIGIVAVNRGVRVTFSAYPGEQFIGIVESMNPIVEQQSRTARVSVRVPNPRGLLLPGMYARGLIEAAKLPNRILVPRSAILTKADGEVLFVLNEKTNRAELRRVTTGRGNDALVEIVENPETAMVKPGEIVLVGGHYTLAPGILVQVVEKPARDSIRR